MQEIKALREWIKKASKRYSKEEIKEILLKRGWKEEEIEKASKKKFPFIFLFLILFVFISLFVYFSLFPFSKEIKKPEAKPAENASTEEIILYAARMFGASSLHAIPLTKNYPVIEFFIDNKSYFVSVEKGKTILKNLSNPDIRIKTTREAMLKIIEAEKIKEALQEETEKGSIALDIVADEATLLAKGYLSLYKTITGKTIKSKTKKFKIF